MKVIPMPDIFDQYTHVRPTPQPMIYAYSDANPEYKGLLKVGYTAVDIDKRVAQQYPVKRPDGSSPYSIVVRESAILYHAYMVKWHHNRLVSGCL